MPEQGVFSFAGSPRVEETTLDFGLGRSGRGLVTRLKILGRGRAANAVLVELHTPEGRRKVVEKHFVPAGLTRGIYKAFFGAPFPYGVNRDAALACLYRRHVAEALLEAEERCRVAKALYVRQCAGGHWVLGTEWIQGRPVAPPKPRGGPEGGGEPGEMRGLLRQMKAMEKCLLRSGLIGSGWQVATAALVSTANLLRTQGREFVLVDLESGIPAVLAPRYLFMSLTGKPFPMFDDVDEQRLTTYLHTHRDRLREKLGDNEMAALESSAERLVHHSRLWKKTEPAPGRHRTRLLTDRDLRSTIRSSLADRWLAEDRLDAAAAERLRGSRLLFLHPLILGTAFVAGLVAIAAFCVALSAGIAVVAPVRTVAGKLLGVLAGATTGIRFWSALLVGVLAGITVGGGLWSALLTLFPASLANLFLRLAGHRQFRARVARALLNPGILDAELRAYQARRANVFLRERRIPAVGIDRLTGGIKSLFAFAVQDTAARIFPARIHRYLADWRELGTAIQVAVLALFSERIQEHLAYSFVEHATHRWSGLGRLDEAGGEALIGDIKGGEAPEYARGFGTHLAVKFFEPITQLIRAVGVGILVTSPWNPLGYILFDNTGVFRLLITTYRWLRREDRKTSYAVAFVLSPIPFFGTLAFPFQFYHRRPWLGRFLARHSMSRLAGAVPIYGGTGTRVEHWMVRLATPLTAVVIAIIWPLKWLDRPGPVVQGDRSEAPLPRKREWLAPQIDRALEWLARTEEAPDLCQATPHLEQGTNESNMRVQL
ncbi:MAG: hypothetical protein V1798_10415 [Pseudomonadota bacterium]